MSKVNASVSISSQHLDLLKALLRAGVNPRLASKATQTTLYQAEQAAKSLHFEQSVHLNIL